MQTITQNELIEMMESIQGNTHLAIIYDTKPKVTNGPYRGHLRKRVKLVCQVGAIYQSNVRAQRTREDHTSPESFVSEPLPFGAWKVFSKTIVHKGKVYLRIKVSPNNVVERQFYSSLTAKPIAAKYVEPYLVKAKPNPRQECFREVIVRTVLIANIRQIKMNGEIYSIPFMESNI